MIIFKNAKVYLNIISRTETKESNEFFLLDTQQKLSNENRLMMKGKKLKGIFINIF